MREVREVSLGEVAEFIRGVTFKPTDVLSGPSSEGVACMRTKNVQRCLDQEDVLTIPRRLVRRGDQFLQPGDVLISSANSWNLVGKCCWVPDLPGETTFGGFTTVMRVNQAKADPRFVFRWLSSPKTQRRVRSFGRQTTNISNLDLKRCKRLPLGLPSLAEQRRIARILDGADALRAKRREALERTRSLPGVVLAQLLVDQVGVARTRPLSEVVRDIRIGPFGTALHKDDYVAGGVPVINPMHIGSDGIEANRGFAVNDRKYAELSSYHLQPGDLILGRRGEMGRCAVVGNEHAGMVCGTGSMIIRPDPSVAGAAYLQGLLSSAPMRSRLEGLSLGATMPNLNKTSLGSLRIPVLPMEIQDRYCRARTLATALQHRQSAHLAHLDALFASLQSRAFSGEL